MRYPAYPKYRDSGVEWLGEVPEHWDYLSLRHILSRNDGGVWGDDFEEEGTIVLRSTDMALDGSWKIAEPARRTLNSREQRVAKLFAGDLLVTKSSGSSLHLGKTAEVTTEVEEMNCCFSNFMQRLRVNHKASSRYIYWLLNGDCGRAQLLFRGSTTTGLANLGAEVINCTITPLPPRCEQIAIATFLDCKTAEIDTLIEKKQKLIELLQENRTAVISHAVSKGLNPKARMKDSGVEWLGEVPEHWDIAKIGHFASVGNGSTPRRDNIDYWADGTIPWLNSTRINDGTISEADQFVTDTALSECHLPMVKPNSILVAITGEGQTRGRAAILDIEATINQHLAFIEFRNKSVSSKYVWRFLLSQYHWLREMSSGGGSTKGAITCEQLKEIKFPLPPLEEQEKITKELDSSTSYLDSVVAKVGEAVSSLQEYRTALISAAVTGKIDVRSGGVING